MAKPMQRTFPAREVQDEIFTQGSDDEGDFDKSLQDFEADDCNSDEELFEDVIDIKCEAAESESNTSPTHFGGDDSGEDHDSDEDEKVFDSKDFGQANVGGADGDTNVEMYDADTDIDEEQQGEPGAEHDDADETEWVRNTHDFPHIPKFTGRPGLKVQLPDDPSAFDIYRLIITDELIEEWTVETNRYARGLLNSKKHDTLSRRSRFRTWKPVTLQEMRVFLAICLHMGLVKKPTLQDYWSRHPAVHSSFCPKVMTRERYLSILAFLHISNNETFIPFDQPNHDPIHKIRPFVTHLNAKFKELYQPEKDVCIDEAMVPFKGRSRFKVYMKDKPNKWGFKLYELCESESGYVCSVEMYCADKRISNKPVDVTMRLMEPLLNKGYRLYTDKYYCCPELWDRLRQTQTMMCGTCRKNRPGMPRDLFEVRHKAGDLDYRRRGQLIVTRWTGKREVVTLSTFHKPELQKTVGRHEVKDKPLAVISYIKKSRTDHSDQLTSFFPMRRKSQKWWKKPFFHLLTLVSIQANILLNKHRRHQRRKKMSLAQVIKELILSLAEKPLDYDDAADSVNLPSARLHERHFPQKCPITATTGRKARRVCKVCVDKAKQAGASAKDIKNKRKQTPFWCPRCKVGLCLECFEVYHTKVDYTAM